MKTSVLLFFSGLALGVGGTMILNPPSKDPAPEAVAMETGENKTKDARRGPTPEQKARWIKRHRHRWGRSDDPRADLDLLLSQVSAIEDESELNLLELVRKTAGMTRLSETEAVDLLHYLAETSDSPDVQIEDELKEMAAVLIFARLCELNGPEAMRLATEDGIMNDSKAFAIGMNSWVAADPDGARRWFEGMLGEADERIVQKDQLTDSSKIMELLNDDDFRKAYFIGMAKHDPSGLEERIKGFESDVIRETIREDLMNSLITNNDTAEGLLEILDKSTDLHEARSSAVEKLAAIDADQAADWVADQPPSKARDLDVTAVGTELMEENPDAGAAWFMDQKMTDPEMAKSRMSRIVYRFASDGLPKAEDWVNRQPDSPMRDDAEVAMAWLYANQGDWRKSLHWLSDVSDRNTREQQLGEIFKKNWNQTEEQLNPELLTAAQSTGFSTAARSFRPE